MLDEKALRRPDFIDGFPVTLADGQVWYLPPVRLRCVPDDGPDGFRLVPTGMGPEYVALVARAMEAKAGADIIRTELGLSRLLLLRNYALDGDQVAELIQFDYSADPDPIAEAIRAEVLKVALGRATLPKLSTATSPGT